MQHPLQKPMPPQIFAPSDPNRPSVFRMADGRTGYRASEIGRCKRALVLCKLGYQPEPFDAKSKSIMEMGNILEPHIAAWWQDNNGGVVQRQVRINMNVQGVATINGVSDGLWFPDSDDFERFKGKFKIVNSSNPFDPEVVEYHTPMIPGVDFDPNDPTTIPTVFGLEIKAPKDAMFVKQSNKGPNDNYKMQISVYEAAYNELLGIPLAGFVFVMRCQEGIHSGQHHAQIINQPYFTRKQLEDRVMEIESLAAKGVDSVDCDVKDFFCRYWRYHKPDLSRGVDSNIYDQSLAELANDYHEVSAELQELESLQKSIKEDLDIAMKGRNKVKTDGYTLYYSSRKCVNQEHLLHANPRMREIYQKFDLEKCLEEHPEFKEMYSIQGERFLTVKSVGIKPEKPKTEKVKRVKKVRASRTKLDDLSEDSFNSVMDQILDEELPF